MVPIKDTEVCVRTCALSDKVYRALAAWPSLAQRNYGTQLIGSLDSVGANLVEGDGRGPGLDALRFFRIVRGSCREARYWLRRATARNAVQLEVGEAWVAEITTVARMINGLMAHRKEILPDGARESPASYDEPFLSEPQLPNFLIP